MDRRRILMAVPVLAAVLAAIVGSYLLGAQQAKQNYEHAVHVEVYVYKNGELVYYDPDDPATRNLIGVFYWLFASSDNFGFRHRDGSIYADFTDIYATYYYGKAIVAVSDGIGAFDRTMYILPGTELRAAVDDSSITYGDNYIQVAGAINVNTTMNITWVGLYSSLDSNENMDNGDSLLFADQLDQPISVQAGDVVTVVYKIVFP